MLLLSVLLLSISFKLGNHFLHARKPESPKTQFWEIWEQDFHVTHSTASNRRTHKNI